MAQGFLDNFKVSAGAKKRAGVNNGVNKSTISAIAWRSLTAVRPAALLAPIGTERLSRRAARKIHGEEPIRDALQLLDKRRNRPAEQWDDAGHSRAVQNGIARVIADRRLAGLSDLSE